MMFKARTNKGAITRFARAHPGVQHLVPMEQEWKTCEIMECCLEPFYDWTCSVSKDKSCLPETIGIMWGLDDLLDDIGKRDGQSVTSVTIFGRPSKQEWQSSRTTSRRSMRISCTMRRPS
jgi:hypothetical protein